MPLASRFVATGVALLIALQAATQVATPSRPPPPLPKDELRAETLIGQPLLGLPETIPGLENSPLALARLRLGRRLFFDPILSADRSVSCASCHQPQHAFATNDVKPAGVGGHTCARNAPTLFNRGFGTLQFLDGRAASLEAQALMPIENPDEMGMSVDEAIRRLSELPDYRDLFVAAGAAEPNRELLAASLAEFVRRLVAGDSPIDRFRAAKGDLTTTERQGLWLFESRGRCWRCHAGPNFSDESFHDTGIGAKEGHPEPGRAAITKDEADLGRFKTPTLRMVAATAPYMHDGSLATLNDVLAFYQRGGNPNDHLDPLLKPVELTDADVAALIALLQALSTRAGDS